MQPHNTTVDQFPWTSWPKVRDAVSKLWDPQNDPHHVIIGGTGSGKSYLAVNGILKPMCAYDRVLIVDTKGDDPIVSQMGKACRELPRNTWWRNMSHKQEAYKDWHRIVSYDDNAKAREQIGSALHHVINEGNWVIYLDEAVEVVDSRKPNLGLADIVSFGLRKGRSKNVSFINATQAPVWVPRWMIDQSSFVWIGRIRDEVRQKRLQEVGGLARQDLPYVRDLKKREWLLAADPVDMFHRTMVD